MDVAIYGMGLPSAYLASRLSAEGLVVGLFGKVPDMVSEPVSRQTIEDFSLDDFTLNKLNFIANFNKDFELTEKVVDGHIVSTKKLYWHYINKAMQYGCEILEGSDFDIERNLVSWHGKGMKIDPKLSIIEEAEGKPVSTILAGRIPFNADTVEFYDDPDMWVVPTGNLALIGGKMDFSWHKFERMSLLKSYSLAYVRPSGHLVDEVIRVGRAAGHTSKEGFVIESSLHNARLLVDTLIAKDDLKIYDKAARKTSPITLWLKA
ncbi:MAG: hypothetical protein GOU98_04805 [Candidatus Altiarchaeota archaeon]|nr:hypothetical protein [Candidatus Altiarchaeota archaeon]